MSNLQNTILKVGITLLLVWNVLGVVPKTYLYKTYYAEVVEPDVRVSQGPWVDNHDQVKVITGYTKDGPVHADRNVSVQIHRRLISEKAGWYSAINLIILISTLLAVAVSRRFHTAA
jgi:hypothetical protein